MSVVSVAIMGLASCTSTIPVVVQVVNAASKSGSLRAIGEKVAGVHKDAWVPEFAPRKFRPNAPPSKPHVVRDGPLSPGRVAIFSTCYVNYNEPGIGQGLVEILEHNAVPAVLVEKEACCGMPKLELGDLEAVSWTPPCETGHPRWTLDVWYLLAFDGRVGSGRSLLVDLEDRKVVTVRDFSVRAG